ncbi:MAG: PD-(D/E)XK nuclease family protein [Candidatus Omnitrophota bacterium]
MKNFITYSLADNFIVKLADDLESNFLRDGKDIGRLALVFGGKRPALFLKRELARRIGKSFFSPRIFTIDEFIGYAVQKKETFSREQDLDSCYALYQLAKTVAPEILIGREGFAQFLPWAREVISFIDQMDLENVEDKTLLNIQAHAQIGYAVPEDINHLLKSVVALKQAYHQELKRNKIYSRGFQYLRAAERIAETDFDEFDRILFCNFFYFNRSEEKIVKSLYERGKAVLVFQGDERQWPILKRIGRSFGRPVTEGERPYEPKYKLTLAAAFDVHSQVGVVREILKTIKNLDNTVIVLPHPDNIIPLLSEITHLVKDFNISMGYPLRRSSLYTLFALIFKAQLSKKKEQYYTRDYLQVLRHPFIKNLKFFDHPSVTRILVHKIEEILMGKEKTGLSGSSFITLDEVAGSDEVYFLAEKTLEHLDLKVGRAQLESVLRQIHDLVFAPWEDILTFKDFARVLNFALDVLTEKSPLRNYPLNLNIADKMYSIKDEFLNASFLEEKFPREEIFKIFDSKVSREVVAFEGSPLKGLQIVGLFETRSLNFENVIVLDVNEGVLPRLRIYEPLIPREVMLSLDLDRLELEEEIQRYQFMRLIASARNVYLVYQESQDKEKSRFVEQLVWGEQKRLKTMDVFPMMKPSFEVKVVSRKKGVKKTPQMIECLKRHTYSASSINTYLRDPMEFYYSYVLGLKEQEDLLDEPEARHVGTFIHELLEEGFRPFLHRRPQIDDSFRFRFLKIFERKFEEVFVKNMKSDSFLLRSVMVERLNRFLDHEQFNEERQVEEILYLENCFEGAIPFPAGEVKFKYVVDRVDRLKDGTVMILDYKTGSIDQMPKSIDLIANMPLSRESISENIKSFQIPLYYYFLDKQFKEHPINAALYNLRTLDLKKFDKEMDLDRDQVNKVFLRALDFIMNEIFDPDVDFVAENNSGRY